MARRSGSYPPDEWMIDRLCVKEWVYTTSQMVLKKSGRCSGGEMADQNCPSDRYHRTCALCSVTSSASSATCVHKFTKLRTHGRIISQYHTPHFISSPPLQHDVTQNSIIPDISGRREIFVLSLWNRGGGGRLHAHTRSD